MFFKCLIKFKFTVHGFSSVKRKINLLFGINF